MFNDMDIIAVRHFTESEKKGKWFKMHTLNDFDFNDDIYYNLVFFSRHKSIDDFLKLKIILNNKIY